MALAYGKHPKSYEDPDILAVNRCLTRLGNTLRPGVWKVDIFPFLRLVSSYHFGIFPSLLDRYIPGYLKELQDGHAEELALFKRQLHDVRFSMVCLSPILMDVVELILDGGFFRKKAKNSLSHLGNTS